MELTVPASPPRTSAPHQEPSDAKLAQAVTDMVLQIRQTVATTSSITSSQCDSQASEHSPRGPPPIRIPRVTAIEPSQL